MKFSDFVRQSFFGRTVYHVSKHKYFSYKEEAPDYVLPEKYLATEYDEKIATSDSDSALPEVPQHAHTHHTHHSTPDQAAGAAPGAAIGAIAAEVEEAQRPAQDQSSESTVTNGKIIVTWDGDDDPENPFNWPLSWKIFLILQIAVLTTSVYMGAAIYTPGVEEIKEKFHISTTVASLPLSLFVIGYGLGPMVWSPFSEHPAFGRTSIYFVTLFIFFILQIPTALVNNIAGLCVLRFIAGFFASPCLSTGGASISDFVPMAYGPLGIAAWSMAAVCGPSLGPLIGSALTVAGGWRWTFWFLAITSGTCLISLSFFLPETYGRTILLRKAKRLRALTGNQNIVTEDEIELAERSVRDVVIETLYRPLEVSIIEPVVLLIDLYIALVYSVMYLWFEAFPIVFQGTYGFTLVELGVSYVAVMIGIILGCIGYVIILKRRFTDRMLKGEMVEPELFIPFAIVGSVIMPIGIFIFSFTATKSVHWIVPLIGAALFAMGAFLIFQSLFNYLGMSFFRYLASVFAGNALFRSVIAGVFPLFGHFMYNNLATPKFPVGWGSAILGFIALAAIAIPVLFYLNGPRLRARSKYAGFGNGH